MSCGLSNELVSTMLVWNNSVMYGINIVVMFCYLISLICGVSNDFIFTL